MKPIITAVAIATLALPAYASGVKYEPRNPNISPGASSFNASGIDARASLTRPKDPKSIRSSDLDESSLLRRSVISSLASRYNQLLTGSSPDSGTINFGDGSYADYRTDAGIRYIIFHNPDGTSTEVSFPL